MKEKIINQAVAYSTMPISLKHSINIGKWIKGENVDKAILKLQKVIEKELPLPCVKFNKDVAHKKGLGVGGRYPKNASKGVIKLLKLAKANAKNKGMDESKLIINEFIANYAISKNKKARYKAAKSTHLKIGVVAEK